MSTGGNLLNRICRDLLPDQTPGNYGQQWVPTAPDGHDLKIRPGDDRPLAQLGMRDNMRLEIRKPLSVGHTEERLPAKLEEVPEILHRPLLERRAALNETMNSLFTYIDRETRSGNYIQKTTIIRKFEQADQRAGIYYRLQVLYLLGLIDKRSAGRDEHGNEQFQYALSPAYREQTGQPEGGSVTRKRHVGE